MIPAGGNCLQENSQRCSARRLRTERCPDRRERMRPLAGRRGSPAATAGAQASLGSRLRAAATGADSCGTGAAGLPASERAGAGGRFRARHPAGVGGLFRLCRRRLGAPDLGQGGGSRSSRQVIRQERRRVQRQRNPGGRRGEGDGIGPLNDAGEISACRRLGQPAAPSAARGEGGLRRTSARPGGRCGALASTGGEAGLRRRCRGRYGSWTTTGPWSRGG